MWVVYDTKTTRLVAKFYSKKAANKYLNGKRKELSLIKWSAWQVWMTLSL